VLCTEDSISKITSEEIMGTPPVFLSGQPEDMHLERIYLKRAQKSTPFFKYFSKIRGQ